MFKCKYFAYSNGFRTMRHKIIIFSLAVIALLTLSCTRRSGYVKIEGYAQGGVYSVTFNINGIDKEPSEIRDTVESILHRIDFTLSGYNRNSVRIQQEFCPEPLQCGRERSGG